MDKLGCIHAFCEVVKEGGFSAAARKMNISKVLVSRYVAQLENDLGVRLLHRTTRKMSPTEQGQAYYERCTPLLEEFQNLDDAMRDTHQQTKGRLKISVPSEGFVQHHLLDFFSHFHHQHPQIQLDIQLSDRYVDIVEEGFDIAIRVGKLEDSSLIARKLSEFEVILCASADYLKQAPPIQSPKDLEQHSLVIDSNYRGGQHWRFSKEDTRESVRIEGNLRINSAVATSTFLRDGLGVGLCLSFHAEQDIQAGKLVHVLPDWHIQTSGIYAVYSHRKHLSAKVSSCVTALIEHFASE